MIKYTIAIRTTGRGGEKYQMLLDSIRLQTIQPKEILVVLPEGAALPVEKIGTEKFVFTEKGMMTQRAFGIEKAECDIILCCDDDISFGPEFAELLLEPLASGEGDISVGELLALLPKRNIRSLSAVLSLKAIPMGKRAGKFVRIIRSGGWRYYRFDSSQHAYLCTESAAGAMFMIKKSAWEKIGLMDENWAQHGSNAPMDDQIFFYKAWLRGLITLVVTDAHYSHNDSKNALINVNSQRQKNRNSGFNHRVFWHRFIYLRQTTAAGKLWSHYLFLHAHYVGAAFQAVTGIYKKDRWRLLKEAFAGDKEAKQFIRSNEYQALPPV